MIDGRRTLKGQAGLTLLEVLIVLAIAAVLVTALGGVVGTALDSGRHSRERSELGNQASFAMARMTTAIRGSRRLLVPLAENPATAHSESLRQGALAALAVTLDPTLDRDGDGFADADNDRDGLVDEDLGDDNTNDGAAGIIGIDDDGDGLVDEHAPSDGTWGWAGWWHSINNDEDLDWCEEQLDGIDNDGDGAIDEDINGDMDSDWRTSVDVYDDDLDGVANEDWLDAVVFHLSASGTDLVERMPTPQGGSGLAFSEQVVAENVTLFRVERLAITGSHRATLVKITLGLTLPGGESLTLINTVRVGGGL